MGLQYPIAIDVSYEGHIIVRDQIETSTYRVEVLGEADYHIEKRLALYIGTQKVHNLSDPIYITINI